MKNTVSKISLLSVFAGALFCSMGALASGHYMIGLRTNAGETVELAARQRLPVLEKSAEEFANGNTFVRLKGNVLQSDVDVVLPERMTSNDLMEALITVFTLKKNGASRVCVMMTEQRHGLWIEDLGSRVPIERWLKTAGADSLLTERGEKTLRSVPRGRQVNRFAETVIAGSTHVELSEKLSTLLGARVVSPASDVKGAGVLMVSPAPLPVNENFFKTLLMAAKFRARGAAYVELLTPYLPYARSDKVDQAGVAVTGKLIANLIEASGVDAVSFVRSHAPQSEGFFNIPTRNISGRKTINGFLKSENVEVVVSPDTGFQKDATLYAEEIGSGLAVINKYRDPLTSKTRIEGMSGADVSGKTVAVIDDETASGSTLGGAAEFLKARGAARVIAVVTHLAGNAKGALDSQAIDRVVVTDSLPVQIQHPKLTVLPIAGEIAKEVFSARRATVRTCRDLFR